MTSNVVMEEWEGYNLAAPRNKAEFDEAKRLIKSGQISGLILNAHNGYVPSCGSELADVPEIEVLKFGVAYDFEPTGLECLKNLKCLILGYEMQPFDLSPFVRLEILSFHATKEMDIGKCSLPRLKHLSIWQSKAVDLDFLKCYPALEEMHFTQGTRLESLKGVSSASKLRSLHLAYLSKSIDIDELERCKCLKILELYSVKKVNFNQLGKLQTVDELALNRCGKLKSLDFLLKMKRLESFVLIKTDVSNDDLEPVTRMESLLHLGVYPEKKSFKPSLSDIQEILKSRPGAW